MKADGIGNRSVEDNIRAVHRLRPIKKIETKSIFNSSDSTGTVELEANIEQTEQKIVDISEKLNEMSTLIDKIRNEKNDIIRQRLIRFFNVLKVYIDEALHPSGDWSINRFISGKITGESAAAQEERIDITKINKLSQTPTQEDIDAIQRNIKKAQTSAKKLLNTFAVAKSYVQHRSNTSSIINI